MTQFSNPLHQRMNDAYHEHVATDFIAPGLPRCLYVIGLMIGVEKQNGEKLTYFAQRIINKLDRMCADSRSRRHAA